MNAMEYTVKRNLATRGQQQEDANITVIAMVLFCKVSVCYFTLKDQPIVWQKQGRRHVSCVCHLAFLHLVRNLLYIALDGSFARAGLGCLYWLGKQTRNLILWLIFLNWADPDLEAMFPGSNRDAGMLPRPLPCSRLPSELPRFRLRAQQAVNHPDRQHTCSRDKSSESYWRIWVVCQGENGRSKNQYQCDLDFQSVQNQSWGSRRGQRVPAGGSESGRRSAAGRGPGPHTGTPLGNVMIKLEHLLKHLKLHE